jgi:hypothetical protein
MQPLLSPTEGCEWLDYTCGIFYFWRIPDAYGDDYFNMRFTPESCCTLMTIEIVLTNAYPEFSNVSGQGIDIYVWTDDGTGLPGTVVLGPINVPGSNLVFYPSTVSVDVSSYNLVFCDDFHIGYTVVDQEQDNIAILSDDGTCGELRSSEYYGGAWSLMFDDWGYDVNFLIFAYVCCPVVPSGDDCVSPRAAIVPYSDLNQTTCERVDDYNATCLGYYDGGEDIIYQLDVTSSVNVDITLDPKGTTWTGICIDDACPPDPENCIDLSTESSGDPHLMSNVSLGPGIYYIMVDTWPSPTCIPDFDLTITTSGGPANDDCADAEPVGDVTGYAFTTIGASFDGGGTCQSAPNIWYCYTASCDGLVTVSLCGSSYDTKMAVYDGCTCDPLPAEIDCNDDFCGYQSEVTFVAIAGHPYLIEVGGYGSDVGYGVLTISCVPMENLISDIDFEQQDFYDQDGMLVTPNSEWGKVSFEVSPPTDGIVRYLNIKGEYAGTVGWIVRNFPILPSSVINPGRFSLHFDTREVGVEEGTDLPSMGYVYHLGTAVQTSAPVGSMTTAAVYDLSIHQFGRVNAHGLHYFEGPAEISPPYYYYPVDLDSLRKYSDLDTTGVPPVQEDNSECASGATARSLKWLSNRHGYGLPSAQDIQRVLDNSEHMNQGCTDSQMIVSKQQYIDDNNLPLEVHYWHAKSAYPNGIPGHPTVPGESSDTIDMLDWIWREMEKGQDIEINISWATGGGHSVTLVGIDKKNNKLEYRDDETQGDDTRGDGEIKETDLVPLGRCQVGTDVYITSQVNCTAWGGTWLGFNGEYGFDAAHNYIDCCLAESPKSFDLGWRYHPKYVDGWLTVYGTVDCQTIEPPIFERAYVESCTTYEGYIPLWANDYLIIFEWDYWCGNVDSFKVSDPYWDGEYWRLYPFGPWLEENLPPEGMILPTIGDETGETQYIHTIVNPSVWLDDPREPLPYYEIIDGECDDLPGYLIGTTPITFDPFAPPSENPFETTPFTGVLTCDGDLIFGQAETYVYGDADGSGFVDIDDVVHLINYIFAGGPAPVPLAAGDADCSGFIDIDDVVYLINYIFAGGPPPGDPDGDGVPDC